jgi:hypothetical protein
MDNADVQTRFPTLQQREECGDKVNLTNRQVQVWFQVRIFSSFAVAYEPCQIR